MNVCPMQYKEIFSAIKIDNFVRKKKKRYFSVFAQNIDCGFHIRTDLLRRF